VRGVLPHQSRRTRQVPDISVHDEAALSVRLTEELKALVPDEEVSIVIDHNYSE